MSSRLRSLNSTKISFFAFQDIITSVSGILILVTLILATELETPTTQTTHNADSELQRKLTETLRQQTEVDAKNRSLQQLLAAAETAPAQEKLQTDIERLRSEFEEEKRKQTAIAERLSKSQATIEARDRTLGLSDLKAQIQRIIDETATLNRQESGVRMEMSNLEQKIVGTQSKILKLQEREGKLWFTRDKSSSSKEPILVTVNRSGMRIEFFDHPEQAKEFSPSSAHLDLGTYLEKAKPTDQYVFFLVRPSGITLFKRTVEMVREKGFEVGFDPLEEDREVHFSTPPPLDESPVATKSFNTAPGSGSPPPAGQEAAPTKTNVAPTPAKPPPPPAEPKPTPPPTPKPKSWWQRLLEFIGLG